MPFDPTGFVHPAAESDSSFFIIFLGETVLVFLSIRFLDDYCLSFNPSCVEIRDRRAGGSSGGERGIGVVGKRGIRKGDARAHLKTPLYSSKRRRCRCGSGEEDYVREEENDFPGIMRLFEKARIGWKLRLIDSLFQLQN